VAEDGVGDGGGVAGGADVVDAEDVGSGEDGGYIGGLGGDGAGLWGDGLAGVGGVFVEGGDGLAEEAFTGDAAEDGQVELVEVGEVAQEGVVLEAELAEAEAGIENDLVGGDAGGVGEREGVAQAGEDEGEDLFGRERREGGPVLRAAAGVHQDGAALEAADGAGHGWVPEEAADVVDDLGAGFDGAAGGGGVVGVDGENRGGAVEEDGVYDGKDAGLLLFGRDGGGGGSGGLAAEIEEVRAFVEHAEGLIDRGLGGKEMAAVGEGVGGDVEDAHDAGVAAEREGAGAEAPVVCRTWVGSACGHRSF
jgi:hypothetical protein